MGGIYEGPGVGCGSGVGLGFGIRDGKEMGKSDEGRGLSGGWWGDDKSSKTGGFESVSSFVPEYAPGKTQQVFGPRNAGTGYHKQNLSIAKAEMSHEFPDQNLQISGCGEKTPRRPAEYKSYFGSSQTAHAQAQLQPQTPTANTNYSTTQKCYDHKSPN